MPHRTIARSPFALRRAVLGALAVLLVLGTAAAQPIPALLPAETALALGVRDLAAHQGAVQPFLDEFERLGLGDALAGIAGDVDPTMSDDPSALLPAGFEDLGPLDVLGRDAWVAVSISQFNPLPVLTLAARTSPAATDAFAEALAAAKAREDVETLSEGGVPFSILPVDAGAESGLPVRALVAAQSGDLVVLSSDPDAMRGVLRRLTGSGEASLATSEGYRSTVASLGDGNVIGYLDLGALASAIEPYTQALGLPELVARLARALDTAGATGGVLRVVDGGLEGESVLAPNPSGDDPALFTLLTGSGRWVSSDLDLMPRQGLSISAGAADLEGWWSYLDDLVAGVRELGISSLDDLTAGFGLDLRSGFFDWYAGRYAVVTTGVGDVAAADALPENFLGDSVYAFASADDAAATQGLALLLNNLAVSVASFADPTGGTGGAQVDVQNVLGVDVTRYQIFQGVELHTAVVGGMALVATSSDAMAQVLGARAEGRALPDLLVASAGTLPADARSVSLSDNRATTAATASQIASQVELAAGLGGAANLDFDATEAAATKVEDFLRFVAERLGASVSSTRVDGNRVITTSFSEVAW